MMITAVGVGQSQSDENRTEGSKTGAITGRVVNESGQPLANASVIVRAFGAGSAHMTSSGSDGSFQVSGLDPVLYTLSAYLPAYVTAPRDPDSAPIGYFRVGDAARLELIRGGVITGTVTNAAGEPVVVVRVRAHMVRDGNGQRSRYGSAPREVNTDDRGVYRIYGLSPGTYLISSGGGESEDGFNVRPYGNDAPTYAPSSTRDTAMEIIVHSGEEAANVDIRYRGDPGHRVSGVAKSTVALGQATELMVTLTPVFNGASQTGYTSYQSPAGRGFSFSGIADGDYYITARASLAGEELVISEPRRLNVRGADITGLELSVRPMGSINGRVMLEESPAPECKGKRRPVFSEIVVTPWHNEKTAAKDQPQFLWALSGPKLVDKQGEFAMGNLPTGQYRFNIRSMARYWYLKSMLLPPAGMTTKATMTARPADAMRNWTTLKPGERLSVLIITLAEGAASIRGRVDLAEGRTLPQRLFIYLIPAERESAEDVARFFGAMVLPDRSFEVSNLPPGRYWALARAAGENELNVLSKLRLPDEAETRAKLRQDAEAGKIETELKPCQNVTDYRLPFGSNGPAH
jgi:hypothetical protein